MFKDFNQFESNSKYLIDEISALELDTNAVDRFSRYFYELGIIASKVTVRGKSLEFLSRVNNKSGISEVIIRTKLKDKIAYQEKIRLTKNYDVNFELLKEKSINILLNIYKAKLGEYFVETLNKTLVEIGKECNVALQFDLSNRILVDITDSTLTVGLTVEQALKIPTLLLYKNINGRLYKEWLRCQLKICQTTAQLFKYDNCLFTDLGVYNKSRLDILLRNTYGRRYECIGKNGVGYILTENYVALIASNDGAEYLKLKPISLFDYLYVEENLGF